MPEYVTVYQISGHSSGWPFACIGLIPLLVGGFLVFGKLRFDWQRPGWFQAYGTCALGLLWISALGIGIFKKESQAFTAFRTGDYFVAEGVVANFHPMPYEGHDNECFSVGPRRFCYSDYDVTTPGFHNTASHGGPIRPGLSVRIAYNGPNILRLDIAKDQVRTPAESRAMAVPARRESQTRSENDSLQQGIATAFLFTAVGLTLLWNLYWRRTMEFWLRPPYRRFTEYAFRVFFALNLIGAVSGLIQQLSAHPFTRQNVGPTMTITAVMFAVVVSGYALALWLSGRLRHKGA